jgi:O-antigen ligase
MNLSPLSASPAQLCVSTPASALRVPAESRAREASRSDLKWDLLLVCVAGYVLTAVGRVHQLFPALGVLRPAMLTGLLAIVLFWFDRYEIRRARHLFTPPTKFLLALLCWMMLSVTGALVPGASFELVVDNFLKTVLMYLVVAGSVRTTRDVERLAMIYLAAAAVYSIVVVTRFEVGIGNDWRLGRLYYYDANDFATFAVTAMPIGLYFLHASRRTLGRALAALALVVLALAFVRAGSRGGFIALAAVAGFVVLRYTGVALRWRMCAAAIVTLVVMGTASDRYWEQMSTILSDTDYNRTHESGRLQIWRRGVGYMLGNPVFGVGPQNFQAAEGMLSAFHDRQRLDIGVRWNAAHNSFIQIGAELGIPGLVMFVAFIAASFGLLRRASRRGADSVDTRHRALTQALMAALIGFVVGACFLSLAYSEMLYTLAALAAGIHKVMMMPDAGASTVAGASGIAGVHPLRESDVVRS